MVNEVTRQHRPVPMTACNNRSGAATAGSKEWEGAAWCLHAFSSHLMHLTISSHNVNKYDNHTQSHNV